MKKLVHFLLASLLCASCSQITACGKTGPLYLPDTTPQQPSQQDK